jgi:hypothetical protein
VPSEAYEGEAMKKPSVFGWHKRFEESLHIEILNGDNAFTFFDIKGTLFSEFISQDQSAKLITHMEMLK